METLRLIRSVYKMGLVHFSLKEQFITHCRATEGRDRIALSIRVRAAGWRLIVTLESRQCGQRAVETFSPEDLKAMLSNIVSHISFLSPNLLLFFL